MRQTQYFFQNQDANILATTCSADITQGEDWDEYLIHAYIRKDKSLPMVYLDIYPLVMNDYELKIETIYEFVKYIVEEFPYNKWIFQYNGERFTMAIGCDTRPKYIPKYLILPFIPGVTSIPRVFPKFWYESNSYFGNVDSYMDLETAMEAQTSDNGVFNTLDDFLDRSYQNINGNLDFGSRVEHKADKTLRQFLSEKGILKRFYNHLNRK